VRDIDRALANIIEIRSQLARQSGFRGYGPATMASTGVLAALVGLGQALIGPAATAPIPYLATWIATAIVACLMIGAEAVTRSRRVHSRLADTLIVGAVEQFLPAGAAGALLALVLWRFEPGALWMLPGLWQILVSLGLFAASRCLPRALSLAGAWYLVSGLTVLILSSGAHAMAPWAMAVPFAIGQPMIAAILAFALRGADD
jgi:hypothetical protein